MSTEVHQAAETVTTSNELDLLFGPLFDEYFNGENQVVLKSSAVTTTDASNKRQQQPDSTSSTSTLATTVTANGNFYFTTTGHAPIRRRLLQEFKFNLIRECFHLRWLTGLQFSEAGMSFSILVASLTAKSCFYSYGFQNKIFSSAVTAPGIVEVDVPSAFVVVRATGLKELPSSMISQRA
ncbi:hypothetical protein Tco_1118698 [Tanacetum coccineum]